MKNKVSEIIQSLERPLFPFKATNDWFQSIGITKQRFYKILKKVDEPTLSEVTILAQEFGVKPSELIEIE